MEDWLSSLSSLLEEAGRAGWAALVPPSAVLAMVWMAGMGSPVLGEVCCGKVSGRQRTGFGVLRTLCGALGLGIRFVIGFFVGGALAEGGPCTGTPASLLR